MAPTRRNAPRMENERSSDPSWRDMARVMQAQIEVTAQLVARMNGNNGNGNARDDDDYLRFTQFQKSNPPSFQGSTNPDEAEGWIKEIEKIYQILGCTEEQKVKFATHMLQGDAEFWWNGEKTLFDADGVAVDWNLFKATFFEKYFPRSVQAAKEKEFLSLKQGEMSIADYTAKFESLIKFSRSYRNHPDEEWKCFMYESGLRGDILSTVGPLEIRSFSAMVSKCRVAEQCNQVVAKEKEELNRKRMSTQPLTSPPPRKKFNDGRNLGMRPPFNGDNNRPKPTTYTPTRASTPNALPNPCTRCGRPHGGECRYGKGVCYHCGKPGHMIKDCPNRGPLSMPKPQAPGRVFTITAGMASNRNNQAQGKHSTREKPYLRT